MPVRPHCEPDPGRPRPLAVARKSRAGTICCCRRTTRHRSLCPNWRRQGDEIVVTKTTDSALTGTNLRLILHNLGIKTCRLLPASSPTSASLRRSAAWPTRAIDVVVVEDCCAAGIGRASRQGTRDHQHDLLPCGVELRASRHDAARMKGRAPNRPGTLSGGGSALQLGRHLASFLRDVLKSQKTQGARRLAITRELRMAE